MIFCIPVCTITCLHVGLCVNVCPRTERVWFGVLAITVALASHMHVGEYAHVFRMYVNTSIFARTRVLA